MDQYEGKDLSSIRPIISGKQQLLRPLTARQLMPKDELAEFTEPTPEPYYTPNEPDEVRRRSRRSHRSRLVERESAAPETEPAEVAPADAASEPTIAAPIAAATPAGALSPAAAPAEAVPSPAPTIAPPPASYAPIYPAPDAASPWATAPFYAAAPDGTAMPPQGVYPQQPYYMMPYYLSPDQAGQPGQPTMINGQPVYIPVLSPDGQGAVPPYAAYPGYQPVPAAAPAQPVNAPVAAPKPSSRVTPSGKMVTDKADFADVVPIAPVQADPAPKAPAHVAPVEPEAPQPPVSQPAPAAPAQPSPEQPSPEQITPAQPSPVQPSPDPLLSEQTLSEQTPSPQESPKDESSFRFIPPAPKTPVYTAPTNDFWASVRRPNFAADPVLDDPRPAAARVNPWAAPDDDENAEDAIPTEHMAEPLPISFNELQSLPSKRRSWPLIVGVCAIVLIAAAVVIWQSGYFRAPQKGASVFADGTSSTSVTETSAAQSAVTMTPADSAVVQNFTASVTEGSVPVTVGFEAVTDSSAKYLGLIDDSGKSIDSAIIHEQVGDVHQWTMTVEFTEPYQGLVHAYYTKEDNFLVDSGMSVAVDFK